MSALVTLPLRARGRAWVVGGQVTTDDLFPGFAMKLPLAEAAQHVLSGVRPGWADQVGHQGLGKVVFQQVRSSLIGLLGVLA